MTPKFVYLHIPKSAGTTHRQHLNKLFGDQLLWYGQHTDSAKFDADEAESFFSLGGHRQVSFFPESLNALYTSVVRDPLSRAGSYYSYRVNPSDRSDAAGQKKLDLATETWRSQGMDPDSLVNSIEQCDTFREHITNYQCAYLSRYEPTLDGVLKTFSEGNFVVGDFASLHLFYNFFHKTLMFPNILTTPSNISRGQHSSRALSEPGAVDLIRELNTEDQRLYDYIRYQCSGLHAQAENIEEVSKTGVEVVDRVSGKASGSLDWNFIQLYSKGIFSCGAGLEITLAVDNPGGIPIELSGSESDGCAIGWRAIDSSGKTISSLTGTVSNGKVIPAAATSVFTVKIDHDEKELQDSQAEFLELCLSVNGSLLRDKYPLNSAFLKLL
jgi:Sulfotransferase family